MTRESLLAHLNDCGDRESWQEFVDRYAPFILRVALKSGLTEVEAQDAVQETLLAVARHIKDFVYDPARCSFKSWLMLIARQRIIWQLRKRLPAQGAVGSGENTLSDTVRTATVERLSDPNALNLDAVWAEEWQNHLLAAALEKVKREVSPRQFQIFDLYVLQNWPATQVARTLRISLTRVYLAKHRVSGLLKKEVSRLRREPCI